MLCHILDRIDIEWEYLDETRCEDIVYARHSYIDCVSDEIFDDEIEDILGREPSVFELLATLSVKIEDKVMSNPIYGDRTSKWFWTMIENLDISVENCLLPDEKTLDVQYIADVCRRWLDRQYTKNGDGSPFPLRNPPEDCREIDMWRLAMYYFNENFEGKW